MCLVHILLPLPMILVVHLGQKAHQFIDASIAHR